MATNERYALVRPLISTFVDTLPEEEKLEAKAAKEEEKDQRREEQFHRDKRADATKEEMAEKIRDEKEREAKTKEEWKRFKGRVVDM